MMISRGNAGQITEKGRFSCALWRMNVGSNSIFCPFCRCWVHKRCNGIVVLKVN